MSASRSSIVLPRSADVDWEHRQNWDALWAKGGERDSRQTDELYESQRRTALRPSRSFTRSNPAEILVVLDDLGACHSGACAFERMAAPAATTVSNQSSCISGPKRSLGCASESARRRVKARLIMSLAVSSRKSRPVVEKTIERAAEAVKCAIDKGVLSAMNTFNKIPES